MTEALKAAKEAFGPEAVILGVKTSKPSGRFMGKWKKQTVTLTAATDRTYPDGDTVSISREKPASFTTAPGLFHSPKTKAPGRYPMIVVHPFARLLDRGPVFSQRHAAGGLCKKTVLVPATDVDGRCR